MEEAGVVADGFRHATQERDDLVFNFALDLANARNVEASLFLIRATAALGTCPS